MRLLLLSLMLLFAETNVANAAPYSYSDYTQLDTLSNIDTVKTNTAEPTSSNETNLPINKENNNFILPKKSKVFFPNESLKIPTPFKGKDTSNSNKKFNAGIYYQHLISGTPIKDGPFKQYHVNGKLRFDVNYKNYKLDGPYKEYYLNGQLKAEGTYTNGKPNGWFKFYYENGKFRKEVKYKNGKVDKLILLKDLFVAFIKIGLFLFIMFYSLKHKYRIIFRK